MVGDGVVGAAEGVAVVTAGSAWENPAVLDLIEWVWGRGGPSGSMVGGPVRLPDGSVYEIEWDDEGVEGAA